MSIVNTVVNTALNVLGDVRSGVLIDKDGLQGAAFKEVVSLGGGFGVDLAGNMSKIGLGINKDIYSKDNISISAGAYVMTPFESIFKGNLQINPAVGLSVRF